MDGANSGVGWLGPSIGAAVRYLGQACIEILEVAELDRFPELPAVIHLDIGEIGVALFQRCQAREKLGDASMIGLG